MALATIEAIRDAVPQLASSMCATIASPNFGLQGGHSFWTYAWVPGGTGVAPAAAGANPTKATAGAFPFRNAGAGLELRLVGVDLWLPAAMAATGLLVIYDRLWASGGHDATSTALVSFTSAITRGDTTGEGEGVELWLEIYTAIGATSATATITYTNQAGTGGRTATVGLNSSDDVARNFYFVELQAGDTGVRSVESVQLSATTGAVGSYGLTLARRITTFPMRPTTDDRGQQSVDVFGCGFPVVEDDACLAVAIARGSNGTPALGFLGLTLDLREG